MYVVHRRRLVRAQDGVVELGAIDAVAAVAKEKVGSFSVIPFDRYEGLGSTFVSVRSCVGRVGNGPARPLDPHPEQRQR